MPDGHRFQAVEAQRSLAQLHDLLHQIVADRSALADGTPPPGLPAEILATKGVFDLGLSERHNVVTSD